MRIGLKILFGCLAAVIRWLKFRVKINKTFECSRLICFELLPGSPNFELVTRVIASHLRMGLLRRVMGDKGGVEHGKCGPKPVSSPTALIAGPPNPRRSLTHSPVSKGKGHILPLSQSTGEIVGVGGPDRRFSPSTTSLPELSRPVLVQRCPL